MKKLALIFSFFTLVACTPFKAQTIPISPNPTIQSSTFGSGHDLAVNVVDERPQKLIGNVRGPGLGGEIFAAEDVATSIQKSISEGLLLQGFKISEKAQTKTELRIELRSIDYGFSVGMWDATLRVNSALKAVCVKNGTRPFENLYRGEVSEKVMVIQNEKENTVYINKAISEAESQLLSDKDLLKCLAQ